MELIYTAKSPLAPKFVIDLDLVDDLHEAGKLPDSYYVAAGRWWDDPASKALIESFERRYLANLKDVAEERDVTVWVSYGADARQDPVERQAELEMRAEEDVEAAREIWQEAHDRTPALL